MDRLERAGLLAMGSVPQTGSRGGGLPENPAQGRRVVAVAGTAPSIPVPPLPANLSISTLSTLSTISTAASTATTTTSATTNSTTTTLSSGSTAATANSNTISSTSTSAPPPVPVPVPKLRNAPSNPTLTASAPIAASQVIALAREAMKEALRHRDQQAGDGAEVSNELKPGLTIDLSRKNIQKLPEEVVDIIMNKLERLALSHNKLSSFPSRFSECSSLRYLNVRNNDIREFPLPLCDLRSLEILDLGRNKLRVLPPEIVKLTSLKVFAVQRNRIEELPLCLADMASLQMLKLEGNPIRFPPPEVFQVQASSPTNEGYLKESEVTEVTMTSHVKKFLKATLMTGRAEAAAAAAATGTTTSTSISTSTAIANGSQINGGGPGGSGNGSGGGSGASSDTPTDDSSDVVETPRLFPPKRVASGRFPIKVNGTEVGDLRSPGQARPPPIPSRSHYRGLSQQNAGMVPMRRPSGPGVMPLTIGNFSERMRSNSETTLFPTPQRSERSGADRFRRLAMIPKKAPELGTLEEADGGSSSLSMSNGGNGVNNNHINNNNPNNININRFSHYRGLSHGSAMQGNGAAAAAAAGGVGGVGGVVSMDSKSPASPASDLAMQRPIYVRRLSVLPERRRESKVWDPVVEAAKGVLYSVFQIHPMIQMLMSLANDGTKRRSSLEIVFYNTNSHVEQLEREIQRYEMAENEERETEKENENVHRACITLLHAYEHICSLLRLNVDLFLDNGDPRYMRTLLLQLYHSIMELRVASAGTITTDGYRKSRIADSPTSPSMAAATTATTTSMAQEDQEPVSNTIKPFPFPQSPAQSRETSVSATPTADRPGGWGMMRARGSSNHTPANLRVATDVPFPSNQPLHSPMAYVNGTGRTATINTVHSMHSMHSMNSLNSMSASATTPRSGESFVSVAASSSSGGGGGGGVGGAGNGSRGLLAPGAAAAAAAAATPPEYTEEDGMFEKIFLALQKTAELSLRMLPNLHSQYAGALRTALAQRAPEYAVQDWRTLLTRCAAAIQHTELLKTRLSSIKLKEPLGSSRSQHTSYWQLCVEFLHAWSEFAEKIRDMNNKGLLPSDTRARLRPLHQCVKDTKDLILRSPWAYTLRQSRPSRRHNSNSSSNLASPQQQQPMTPQSAALGPAVQSTVPSTPQSASFHNIFAGNVFERADALISAGGISMLSSSSRAGTFNSSSSGSFSGFGSSGFGGSSVNNTLSESSMASMSPGPLGPLPFRLHNGSKVAF